jgi:hypothetical protein
MGRMDQKNDNPAKQPFMFLSRCSAASDYRGDRMALL